MIGGVDTSPRDCPSFANPPSSYSGGFPKCPHSEGVIMHPIVIVLVPLVLIVVGMVLNSIGLAFDQPPSSAEQDPTKRLTIERDTFRQFFDRQRSSVTKRQQRVGQYAWLLLIATAGSFI